MNPTVAILIAALVAALGTYLVAVRQFSGKIETSDAKELWAESRSIRDWSQARIQTLTHDAERLEARVSTLEKSNDQLAQENFRLSRQVYDLSNTIIELRSEILDLTTQLKESRQRVLDLEEPNA